ncbi:MAG: dipeptide ABC transporter ATP-binding protein [Nitrospina sp.]|jgi:oligopeptide transport system ATP-binding protein|nr:dipeptide ABC transporter ATP-binding protein [Nitrospina sp.]
MEELLLVKQLRKHFPGRLGLTKKRDTVQAIDNVSFHINKGETLGLVGESGCGKSTTARAILRLIEPTAGDIFFNGQDIRALKIRQMRALRKEIQMIFQDPYASLNPRMTVRQIIGDSIDIHHLAKGKAKEERVDYLIESVGLKREQRDRYPHQFSGGQRQRVGIARALATEPKLIICDEPVSALDVSIQAQIINLLEDLQSQFDLSYLFITHDLAVVEHICDRIVVMYLGRVVESAPYKEIYANPLHPYTEALLSAVPAIDPQARKKNIILKGDVPSPVNPPSGCHFHPRCIYKVDDCEHKIPELKESAGNHLVACHLRTNFKKPSISKNR